MATLSRSLGPEPAFGTALEIFAEILAYASAEGVYHFHSEPTCGDDAQKMHDALRSDCVRLKSLELASRFFKGAGLDRGTRSVGRLTWFRSMVLRRRSSNSHTSLRARQKPQVGLRGRCPPALVSPEIWRLSYT
jgi:hypothetical protein